MIAYKGFKKDLTATFGKGIYQYRTGETLHEEKSKTRSTGFHSAEYILDCMKWYPLNGENRFFEVEAAGSIDEEAECSMVVSTEITLLRELTIGEIALVAVRYMIEHPKRNWEESGSRLCVNRDMAEGTEPESIIIARGAHPKVKAQEDSAIGLIVENEDGIQSAIVRMVRKEGAVRPGIWYTITETGKLKEVQHNEKKED
jgi:hypothetical protein